MTHDNLNELISQLKLNHPDIITKAIQDLIHIDSNSTSENDVKLTQVTIQELKETYDVYQSTRDIKKACIFGSARSKPDHPNYIMTDEIARRLIDIDFMTITGAGPGIMEAGNKGAGRDHSFGLNIILPFEQEANKYILNDPKLIDYKYFYTRKLAFIKESHASICFPGGFGTHDEGFEVLTLIQTGRCAPRPVIMMSHPDSDYWERWEKYIKDQLLDRHYISPEDMDIFQLTKSVDECIHMIDSFYKNYHSIRYIGKTGIIRINHKLEPELLKELSKEFSDIACNGDFTQGDAEMCPEDSHHYTDKYRLVFPFNKVNYGRLYKLIEKINQ